MTTKVVPDGVEHVEHPYVYAIFFILCSCYLSLVHVGSCGWMQGFGAFQRAPSHYFLRPFAFEHNEHLDQHGFENCLHPFDGAMKGDGSPGVLENRKGAGQKQGDEGSCRFVCACRTIFVVLCKSWFRHCVLLHKVNQE